VETDTRHFIRLGLRRAVALGVGYQAQQSFPHRTARHANRQPHRQWLLRRPYDLSAFSSEAVALLQQERFTMAMIAIVVHVSGSLLMTLARLASWKWLRFY
jgi:hypothetical protein